MDFAVPADPRVKSKKSEKKDKYLDLAKELKKLWDMKVRIIPIVIGALGTVTKGLIKGQEDLPLKMVSLIFFSDGCTQNFFFTGESVCFHSMDCLFDSGS